LCWASHRQTAAFLIWATVNPCSAGNIDKWKPPVIDPPSSDTPVIPIAEPVNGAPRFHERLLLVDINQQQLGLMVRVLEDKSGTLLRAKWWVRAGGHHHRATFDRQAVANMAFPLFCIWRFLAICLVPLEQGYCCDPVITKPFL
jgi:hypothetical protein